MNAGPPADAVFGPSEVMAGVGGPMVKDAALEVPPVELITVTLTVPSDLVVFDPATVAFTVIE